MKTNYFDQQLIAARPEDYSVDKHFTDSVMKKIGKSEILSSSIRNMSVTKKETFIMRLRHLPKIAIVAIAVGALVVLTGTTFAVVKTIEGLHNVKVNEASTNNFDREQLNVTFTNCSERAKEGVSYELKRDSGLSAEDGAKTLQARCEMSEIDDWLRANTPKELAPLFLLNQADTITAIGDNTITLEAGGVKDISTDVKILSAGKEIAKSDLKVGNTVFSYPDISKKYFQNASNQPLRIFLVSQPTKYYEASLQSYVNERGPCQNNPARECLKASNINHTVLIAARGGAWGTGGVALNIKEVQGKVVSYEANEIKIDVGKGVIYTIQTPSNIIERYNQTDVYDLAKFDNIYAGTSPEELKIKIGDSLGIAYVEDSNKSSDTISWSQLLTVQLMVERIPNNLDVLRKY